MISNIISASIRTALSIALFFILILAFFFALLQTGLDFEKIDVSGVKIEQLYLKIDKKLIIEAKRVSFDNQAKKSDPGRLVEQIRQGFLGLFFLERLHLESVQVGKHDFGILYEKGLFTLKHAQGEATLQLGWMEPGVAFELKTLAFAEQNLTAEGRGFFNPLSGWFYADLGYYSDVLSGTMSAWGDAQSASLRFGKNRFRAGKIAGTFQGDAQVDLKKMQWDFKGNVEALEIKGELHLAGNNKNLRASLLNATAKTLGPLAEFLPVNDLYRPWIYGNITAAHYEAKEFSLDIDLEAKRPLFNTIYLDAQALDGEIRFNPNLPAARAERMAVAIANDGLHIFTQEGSYEGQSAEAYLHINDLSSRQKRGLSLEIETPAHFDPTIQALLQAYGVQVDIRQTTGQNQTRFLLAIDLSEKRTPLQTHAAGQAIAGGLNFFGLDLLFNEVDLDVNGSQITLKKADLVFPGTGTLLADGLIKAGEKHFMLTARAGHLQAMGGLAADFYVTPTEVYGEWNASGMHITVPKFKTAIAATRGTTVLNARDLTLLKPHIPLMDLLELTGGDLTLTHNKTGMHADFNLSVGAPILYAQGQPLAQADGYFQSDPDGFVFSVLDGRLVAQKHGDQIVGQINGLEVDAYAIERYLERRRTRFKAAPKPLEETLFLFGNQTVLRYQNKVLKTDWFSAHMYNDRLEGQLHYKKGSLSVSRNKSDVTLRGERLGTGWAQDLTGMKMTGGSWDLSAYANLNNQDLYGVIRIRDAAFGQAHFLTNVIALINTLPSLVQFRSPGFSAEGFRVERGLVEFYYANDTLFLNAVRLMGTHTDIIAQGSINLKTNEVDIYASVQSIKSASSLVSKIPLVGYLLLGDEKTISNVMHITGTLQKPKIKSEVAKEVVFYPLSVIQRTLTLPLKLFESSSQ